MNIHRYEWHRDKDWLASERSIVAAHAAEVANPHSHYWRDKMFEEREWMLSYFGDDLDRLAHWVDENIPESFTFKDIYSKMRAFRNMRELGF